MKTWVYRVAAFVAVSFVLFTNCFVFAQELATAPEVFRDIYHDVSAPVFTYTDAAPAVFPRRIIRPLPQRQIPGSALAAGGTDQALQTFSLPPVTAPIGKNFDGLSDASNGAVGAFVPSDDNIAVGATQVVETINNAYSAYDKSTGASLLGPKQISTTPSVFQQGTFGAGSVSLWMGSIAMDKIGEMAMGFSQSSSTTHPGIGYTGRVLTDPLNTMEAAATIFTGAGSQTGSSGANRWGDYSSLVLDPADDCTFWYVNQYIPANGVFNFHTRLASFKFPACM